MFKKLPFYGLALLLLTVLASHAYADRRSYVWTYEYKTMPKGEAEIEFYNTLEFPNTANAKVSTWKQLFELEYGITDNWDISLYQSYKQTNTAAANTLSYDGFKVRTRYRFGSPGLYPIDPLVYFELINPNDMSKNSVFEGKIILAKDLGRMNISYNQIYKKELKDSATAENEYSLGLGFEFSPAFKLGLEGKGNYTSGKHYLGPTVSFAGRDLWLNLGVVKGTSSNADQIQARLLFGIFI